MRSTVHNAAAHKNTITVNVNQATAWDNDISCSIGLNDNLKGFGTKEHFQCRDNHRDVNVLGVVIDDSGKVDFVGFPG